MTAVAVGGETRRPEAPYATDASGERDDPLLAVVRVAVHGLGVDWAAVSVLSGLGDLSGVRAVGPQRRVLRSLLALPAALRAELARVHLSDHGCVAGDWVRLPIVGGGRLLGVFVTSRGRGTVTFDAHLTMLRILADHAALAVCHAAALTALAEQHVRVQSLEGELARDGLDRPLSSAACPLTARESEVLRLLARGLSNRDIAVSLFVSESTAKFHVANIMRKLEVRRRAEAVYVAARMGAV